MKFRDMPKLPLALVAIMFAVGAILYPHLPSQIPVHWGIDGTIDRWVPKSFVSVFWPALITLGLYLLLWLVPYLDPQRGNVIRSKQVYSIAIELISGLMTIVFLGSMYAAFNQSLPMDRIIEVAVGVMFVVLGNYLGRVKRNWTMGVRYGWTLSDDVVWAKTNRLGGRLFMVAGVLAILGAFMPRGVGLALVIVPVLIIVPVTYVYSMLLYRRRHPEAMEPPPTIDHPGG